MIDLNFLEKMKQILLKEREDLLSTTNFSADIDTDGDETDEIQGKIIMNVSSQLNIRNNNKLFKINEAIKKIENKTYGLCEDCSEEISQKRLLLRPYCDTCISCAEEREMLDRQRKRV